MHYQILKDPGPCSLKYSKEFRLTAPETSATAAETYTASNLQQVAKQRVRSGALKRLLGCPCIFSTGNLEKHTLRRDTSGGNNVIKGSRIIRRIPINGRDSSKIFFKKSRFLAEGLFHPDSRKCLWVFKNEPRFTYRPCCFLTISLTL